MIIRENHDFPQDIWFWAIALTLLWLSGIKVGTVLFGFRIAFLDNKGRFYLKRRS